MSEKRYKFDELHKMFMSQYNKRIAELIFRDFDYETFGNPVDDLNDEFMEEFKSHVEYFKDKTRSHVNA